MKKSFLRLMVITLIINSVISIFPPALAADTAPPEKTPSHEPTAPIKNISSQQDFSQFITYYYIYPQPDLITKSIYFAEKQGYFDQPSIGLILIAFYSKVFAANPDKLGEWLKDLEHIDTDHKSIIYTALYLADTKQTKKYGAKLLEQMPASYKAQVAKASPRPTPFELRPIKSPAILDELWASFTATGDAIYVKRIMSALFWLDSKETDSDKTLIANTAKWSLASNAIQHKRVLAICKEECAAQPKLKVVLSEIINKAQAQSTKDLSKLPD